MSERQEVKGIRVVVSRSVYQGIVITFDDRHSDGPLFVVNLDHDSALDLAEDLIANARASIGDAERKTQ